MNFTTQRPRRPGYYWLKTGEIREVVQVWPNPDAKNGLWIHHCGDGDCAPLTTLNDTLWAGPIPEPEE
jgi:hypothetical protein